MSKKDVLSTWNGLDKKKIPKRKAGQPEKNTEIRILTILENIMEVAEN